MDNHIGPLRRHLPADGAPLIRRALEHALTSWRWLVDALRTDWLSLTVLGLTVAAAALYFHNLSGKLPAILYESDQLLENVWFEADLHRVFGNMTDRASDHYRTKVHPIFSLAAFPPVHALTMLGFTKLDAVRLFVAAAAGLWAGLFLLTLRAVGLPRLDAVLFTLLACASAAATFFASVAETYLFGSITLLVVMAVAARAHAHPPPPLIQTVVSAGSLSMTVTNWMAGLAMAFALNRPRGALAITRDAFLLIVAAWCVQKLIFPSAEFFISREELKYTTFAMTDTGGPLERFMVLLSHGMVMPAIATVDNPLNHNWPLLTVQRQMLTTHTPSGAVAVVLWAVLLVAGTVTMLRRMDGRILAAVIGLTVVGQAGLHLVYGNESFLYTLHLTPLLVLLAAMGALSRIRPWVLVAAAALTVLAGVNNLTRLDSAVEIIASADEQAGATQGVNERRRLAAMARSHPTADWPKSSGHVVLAPAHAPLEGKGYHVPGGSFSPGFGSFGISIALFNGDGSMRASSNSIAPEDIRQRLLESELPGRYAIETKTPNFDAVWTSRDPGEWELELTPAPIIHGKVALRITSAGPAGGRLRSVVRSGHDVIVNDRWRMRIDPPPLDLAYQAEWDAPRWSTADKALTSDTWRHGFGAAVILVDSMARTRIIVTDTALPREQARQHSAQHASDLRIDLPDAAFASSFHAQIAHLRMGLIDNETRPGDPGNYDQPWARDGGYTIVALARAGDQMLAESLALDYGREDFFGGFGAEADAPGIANWALGEVALRTTDPTVLAALWPHMMRKAELTLEMLNTSTSLYKEFAGTVIPELRREKHADITHVAAPGTDGLINGTMDHHRPVLYVTAMNYLGLRHAAAVALRLGHPQQAAAWQSAADKMRTSFVAQLGTHPDRYNDRTAISALWPSGIVNADNRDFHHVLDQRWRQTRTAGGDFHEVPLWTYFELANAHQHLMTGQVSRAWETLHWFWHNQASPGLYTWWEGNGEENSAGLWQKVRGWIAPQHVTPHYWTAAEMLLLQLDMLAMENPGFDPADCGNVQLTIGQGVPADWLAETVRIEGMPLRCGRIDWTWQNGVVTVAWRGQAKPVVKLGPGFPQNTPVVLHHVTPHASGQG